MKDRLVIRMESGEKAAIEGAAGTAEVSVNKWATLVLMAAARGGVGVAGPAAVRKAMGGGKRKVAVREVVGAGVGRGVEPDPGWEAEMVAVEDPVGTVTAYPVGRRCSRHTTVHCPRCPKGPWRP